MVLISIYYSELFKQNNDKRKVNSIPLAAGKSKVFSIGYLNFLDSYNFLTMPLDQMEKIYGCKTKTLYPNEHFGLDDYDSGTTRGRASGLGSPATTKSFGSKATYDNLIGNLNIEDFKSSLSNKLPKH